jgi:ankyrin repeat protein
MLLYTGGNLGVCCIGTLRQGNEYRDALFEAINLGERDTVKKMAEQEPRWMHVRQDDGGTVLMAAQHLHMLEFLLARGADAVVNERDHRGETVLCRSIRHHMLGFDAVKLLLDHGASDSIGVPDREGCLPLYLAAYNDCLPIAQLLFDRDRSGTLGMVHETLGDSALSIVLHKAHGDEGWRKLADAMMLRSSEAVLHPEGSGSPLRAAFEKRSAMVEPRHVAEAYGQRYLGMLKHAPDKLESLLASCAGRPVLLCDMLAAIAVGLVYNLEVDVADLVEAGVDSTGRPSFSPRILKFLQSLAQPERERIACGVLETIQSIDGAGLDGTGGTGEFSILSTMKNPEKAAWLPAALRKFLEIAGVAQLNSGL